MIVNQSHIVSSSSSVQHLSMAPYKTLSISEKLKIIREVEKGEKPKCVIAKEFDIPKTTLSTIIKNKIKVLNCAESGISGHKFRSKSGEFPNVEKCLVRWFSECREKNVSISGPILQEKTKHFAESLGISNFKASSGWLANFKKRYDIVGKTVCGESASVDVQVCDQWKENLSALLTGYLPEEIYNADETALFYRCMPNKTLEFKNKEGKGGKESKERLTVVLATNMDLSLIHI